MESPPANEGAILTDIVQDHATQVHESQARAQLLEAEGIAKYAPITIASPLERSLADAAVNLEASTAEAAARAEHAEEVAMANLEAAKEEGVVRESGMAEQARTERDIATANAAATQKAVDAEIESRVKAEEQNANMTATGMPEPDRLSSLSSRSFAPQELRPTMALHCSRDRADRRRNATPSVLCATLLARAASAAASEPMVMQRCARAASP